MADWIDVKDEQPKIRQRILCIPKRHKRVCIGTYSGQGSKGGYFAMVPNSLESIRWWMPVPEMPKEEV